MTKKEMGELEEKIIKAVDEVLDPNFMVMYTHKGIFRFALRKKEQALEAMRGKLEKIFKEV